MEDEQARPLINITREMKLGALIFSGLSAALIGAYFLFLRLNYTPIYEGLAPTQTASIASELDAQEVGYKIGNDGSKISVPAYKAEKVRVAIAGAESPLRDSVGFELFNESEMGMTDFAQKIKYQRALQGELARTIIIMENIENARVHISMPEKALFKSGEVGPKAAVTIGVSEGATLTQESILGIQRLVSSSVPELEIRDVVVLNNHGDVISQDYYMGVGVSSPLLASFENRISQKLQKSFPGEEFAIDVVGGPARLMNANYSVASDNSDSAQDLTATEQKLDAVALEVSVRSNSELEPAQKTVVRDTIGEVVALDESQGDRVEFSVTGTEHKTSPTHVETGANKQVGITEEGGLSLVGSGISDSQYLALISQYKFPVIAITGLMMFLALVLLIFSRRRGRELSKAEITELSAQLKTYLSDSRKGDFDAIA